MKLLDGVGESLRSSENVTVSQLMAFIAAAECGSFTLAAQRVKLSQSALSRCIKDAESALGVSLFDRSRKGVVLSDKGVAFLPMAQRLLRSHADAHAGMAQWRVGRPWQLSLMGSVSVMPVVLPTLLRELQREFGCAAMHVGEALSEEVRQHVLDGRAVLGVCAEIDEHPNLRYTPVLEVQFGLLVPSGFALPEPIDSLRALDGLPLVRCREQAICTKVLRQHAVMFPAYFDSPVVVDNVQAATELVCNSGMVSLATGVGASHGKAKGLHFVPLPGLLPTTRVYIVSRRETVFDERQERLRHILRESIHGAPWHSSVIRLGKAKTLADEFSAVPEVAAHS